MLDVFQTTWEDVATEEAANDPYFKEVYDNLTTFRAQYDLWEKNAFLPRAQ
jgi:TRAP-type mannitol/chloroaromatic compound transport system substrate-binding protein